MDRWTDNSDFIGPSEEQKSPEIKLLQCDWHETTMAKVSDLKISSQHRRKLAEIPNHQLSPESNYWEIGRLLFEIEESNYEDHLYTKKFFIW